LKGRLTVAETALEERLSAPLAEFLADRIPNLAKLAHRWTPEVPAADFEQAMWERSLRKADHLRDLWGQDRPGVIVKELRRECRKVAQEDERYRRALKAAVAGYDVYDIEFYSPGVLAKLLPALVEAEFDVSRAMVKASAGTDAAGIHIRTTDPFGGAENYLVILADVAAAFGRLPEGMQRLLRTYYGANQDDTDEGRWDREKLASSMGLTRHALEERARRARLRLADELGGADPWQ
jgi:hypothetical protein